MSRSAASERQVQAADPRASTWLSANAGSGKTRVLTDRVARLLLAGSPPQNILCLTYTKAAASEMQNRLFSRLGAWAMMEEGKLRDALRELGEEGAIDAGRLREARRLFAAAIETPGGLRIQTIHSFCAGLLRRFPLEARVAPQFVEMDERSAALLRDEVIEELADGPKGALFDGVARHFTGENIQRLATEIIRHRAGFQPPLDLPRARALFDLPPDMTEEGLLAEVFLGDEADLMAKITPALLAGSSRDQEAGEKLKGLSLNAPGATDLRILEDVLLYKEKAKSGPFSAKINAFPTGGARKAIAPLMPRLESLMLRVEAARPRRIALAASDKTLALHRFAGVFLPAYEAAKAERGWLDFDDLIHRTRLLLTDPGVAQWVLYRLDGGIDHILIDEAQDTSPDQWRVIELLAQEFTSGAGAREDVRGGARTIFVVGDKKQSIYSFQGADLRAFDAMQTQFRERLAAVQVRLEEMLLEYSFRSAEPILRLVDTAFDASRNAGLGGEVLHRAFHADLPGRVDLWPPLPRAEPAETGQWFDPVDLRSDSSEKAQLARLIAAEINRLIETGAQIPDGAGARALRAGDILILVQRRRDLFYEIIRACKAQGLPIAGADVLKLGADLAVRDLRALLAFLATPEDDLSLAAVLRSPLLGWTEDDLYRLAEPRDGYLWAALRATPVPARDMLEDLRDQADFLRPYDLIDRILTRHDGRRRLLARLGAEAEDGIDALLSQALAYEQTEVPSLTGFLAWLDADDVEVKRRPEAAGDRIRVMTVHGAKGLEAPLVILPETQKRPVRLNDEVLRHPDGPALWKTAAAEMPPAMQAAREDLAARQEEERARLLYVAVTRAEKWLIVCAAGEVGAGLESWHARVDEAMQAAGAVPADTPAGPGLRLASPDWPADAPAAPPQQSDRPAPLPDWARAPAPPAPRPAAPISPSDLGGAKALPGEAQETAAALDRGRRVHLLLEHLPLWPREHWPDLAASLTGAEDAALLDEAARVLAAPDLAFLFAPGTLAEVAIAAHLPQFPGRPLNGVIDRLIVSDERVLAVDYKSNLIAPDRAGDTPDGLLRQMGAYAAALAQVYPGHRIETAILWTGPARLTPLPPELVDAALADAAASIGVQADMDR
jgi:ATP-dependent helicase/nuclease subunit A